MKQMINTNSAPKPAGTYSQGIKAGNTVYIAGQIPMLPETLELITGDFSAQLNQVFKNIAAVADAAGGSLAHIVKLTIYVTDMENQPAVSEVMKKYFNEPYPARAVIEVSRLPKDVAVEVESILVLGE
ncbi:MAG: Rid family detoxifying hydrolase [Coxiellaceae bacterium]|nr:Rid family detoxifying hydrolase [Coxiellaceae bacterium]